MRAALKQRLRLTDWTAESRTDPGVMARALMFLFVLGGTLAVASLAVASSAHLFRVALSAAIAWIIAAALLVAYDALPRWSFELFLAAGTALVLWTLAAAGPSATGYALLLIPAIAYALSYFSKPGAALQTLLAVGGFAVIAAVNGLSTGAWAVPLVGMIAAAGLVSMQRAQANRLIARLADAARTDALTGLLNRRGFEELIETELERSRRSGQPLSLIVADLDRFKALNDHFGHAAGDRALQQLALIMQTVKRRIDTAARIGGEEFAVILPDSDHHAAYIMAERMRREVRETFIYEPSELTVSIGVATFPVHATSVDTLIAQADEALYGAKALGRDRTVVYDEELGESVQEATGPAAVATERHYSAVIALTDVIEAGEGGRVAHSQTVGRYAAAIARELGMPDELIERVRFSGVVHDVGKIGVKEDVLAKPGWLNADEWLEVRRHPEIGARILNGAQLGEVSDWVRAHHERPDGTGYPDGRGAAEIPLEARILAVADAYEAMTSDRIYRSALLPERAQEELRRCAGTQFDPHVVAAFLRVLSGAAGDRNLRLVK